MATATKSKKTKDVEELEVEEKEVKGELDEQIEALEGESLPDVPISVERELWLVDDPTSRKVFRQHEMSYLTKLKFFRLLSGTLRLASQNSEGGTVADLLGETLSGPQELLAKGLSKEEAERLAANSFIETIMKLIELAPDFAETTYLYALNVRPTDVEWAKMALESLDDETGVDILDVFIAQNGKAIKRFFDKHLKRVTQRVNQVLGNQAQE